MASFLTILLIFIFLTIYLYKNAQTLEETLLGILTLKFLYIIYFFLSICILYYPIAYFFPSLTESEAIYWILIALDFGILFLIGQIRQILRKK